MIRSGSWLGPGQWTTGASSRPWDEIETPNWVCRYYRIWNDKWWDQVWYSDACEPWGYVAPVVAAFVTRATGVRHIYLIMIQCCGVISSVVGETRTARHSLDGKVFHGCHSTEPHRSQSVKSEASYIKFNLNKFSESSSENWNLELRSSMI